MSRLEKRFAELRSTGRKALIPYITAGDPEPGHSVALMHAMVAAGADVLELGVPFSDPMADGPVIQAACERALLHDVSLGDVLSMVRAFRNQDADTPVVLMGYLNPVEVMGYARFAEQAATAGVDGVLTVDLPPEEADDLLAELGPRDMDAIFLVAPTTTEARMAKISEVASGFVYHVSLKGVTGAGSLDIAAVGDKLAVMRQHIDLPIGVGFGISTPEAAAAVASVADAVVVGSAIIQKVKDCNGDLAAAVEVAGAFIGSLRAAMDAATKSV